MNNRIIIIILSSVIVLLVASGIFYQRRIHSVYGPAGFDGRGGGQGMMMRDGDPLGPGRRFCMPDFMRYKLDLSDDHISKIRILNETF